MTAEAESWRRPWLDNVIGQRKKYIYSEAATRTGPVAQQQQRQKSEK